MTGKGAFLARSHTTHVHSGEIARGVDQEAFLDFSTPINPLGPPEWLRSCISLELDNIHHYPKLAASKLKQKIAKQLQVDPGTIIVANGSTELLYRVVQTLGCRRVVAQVPCDFRYIRVL